MNAADFVFDTSVKTSDSLWRMYASFATGPILPVFALNKTIPWQGPSVTAKSFTQFDFITTGELRVRAGLVRVALINPFAQPENAGKKCLRRFGGNRGRRDISERGE